MKIDSTYLSKSVGLLNPREPKTVLESSSLKEILEVLKNESLGAVLICDDQEKVIGIFTERDVLKKVAGKILSNKDVICNYMTRDPICISMTSPLAYALQLMSEGGFRHVPITDENGIALGIISMKDIVDEIVKTFVNK